MRGSQTPLRAAFWAMTAALGLTLFLVLSDPYAVRQSLLVRQEQPVRRSTPELQPILVAENERPTSLDRRDASETIEPLPTVGFEAVAQSPLNDLRRHADATAPGNSLPSDVPTPGPSFATARRVSTGKQEGGLSVRSAQFPTDNPSMPVVTPSQLYSSRRRGEFIALPPPPGIGNDDSSSSTAVGDSPSPRTAPVSERERRRLEAELVNIRREVDRLTDGPISQHLHRLQAQQTELFRLQQSTAEQLDELVDEFNESTARIEAILNQRSPE